MNPLISVVVPIYNSETYLRRLVDSILSQTYQNLELILVDDGSSDRSFHICEEYSSRDIRVHAFHKENGGVSSARNLGMGKATGQYLIFADADDYLLSTAVESMYKAISSYSADIAIAGHFIDFYGKRTTEVPILKTVFLDSTDKIGEYLLYLNDNSHFDILWNKIYSMDFLKKTDISFELFAKTSQDLLFNANLFMQNPKILLISNSYYYYYKGYKDTIVSRYHPNIYNIMMSRNKKLAELFDYYNLSDIQEIKEWQANTYVSTIFNSVINNYRTGSPLNRSQRVDFIKNLCLDKSFCSHLTLINPNKLNRITRYFINMCKNKHIHILDSSLLVLYHANQVKKRVKSISFTK